MHELIEASVGVQRLRSIRQNGMRILLVAESKTFRSALRRAIEGFWSDSTIFESEDGLQALQTVADVEGRMDLILSDWKLPRMDGMSFLKQLRAMSLPRDVAVIMIANEADK